MATRLCDRIIPEDASSLSRRITGAEKMEGRDVWVMSLGRRRYVAMTADVDQPGRQRVNVTVQ